MSRYRKVKALITVSPEPGDGFEACVEVGSAFATCALGKNPRTAIANAMDQASKKIRSRRGKYRGLR